MNKEEMINIINQHGVDALYDAINNELITAYNRSYDLGYSVGLNDGYSECLDDYEL